jgi:FdhD protein
MRSGSKVKAKVTVFEAGEVRRRADSLAAEEPLEIRLLAGGERRTVAITMRTPGADFELAAGFLYGEGVIKSREAISRISYCVDEADAGQNYNQNYKQNYNIVNVTLRSAAMPELGTLERHFYTSSACGVCGKASLEALRLRGDPLAPLAPRVSPETVTGLPGKLREAQDLFELTGGLHAAALFSTAGTVIAVREDIGRHNALDKLVGWALLGGRLPLVEGVLLLSGRASFELMQKALAAEVPVVCAVSAPSSLAVSVARAFNMTLIGFLRGERFNVYAGEERLALPAGKVSHER